MNSFKQHLQQKELSNSTITHYTHQILVFITWCDMQNIEPENATNTEITGYLHHVQTKGSSNKTRSYTLNTLKHYFDWQIHTGNREDNPAKRIKIRGIKQKTLYPIFSKHELEQLYHNYEIPTADHPKSKCNWFSNYQLSRSRNKAILSLMIYQGLCTDEVNRLTLTDVNLREGTVFIVGTRKSNERKLDLKPHQIMALMEYQLTVRNELLQLKKDAEPVEAYFLPTPSAGKTTASNHDGMHIWKRLSEEIRKTHSKFINFKQVRTSVITHWLKQHNLRQVQYMAGHRYVSSTESYLVNQVEDLQSDIEQFHPIG
jgi:site-specific recombinase XerD